MNADTHDSFLERLDDYVDGILDPAGRAAVERHLAACPDCAGEVEALRALLARAAGLPRRVEPARDLWPEVRARLRARTAPAGLAARLRAAWVPRLALTGAVAALAVAAWFGIRDRGPVPAPESAAGPRGETAALAAVVQAMEIQCRGAGRELWSVLRERPGTRGAEAAASVAMNLDVLDRAIAETRDALNRDPENRRLLEVLAERYQRKLSLLQEAARLAAHA